jgi:hypothetical protein
MASWEIPEPSGGLVRWENHPAMFDDTSGHPQTWLGPFAGTPLISWTQIMVSCQFLLTQSNPLKTTEESPGFT